MSMPVQVLCCCTGAIVGATRVKKPGKGLLVAAAGVSPVSVGTPLLIHTLLIFPSTMLSPLTLADEPMDSPFPASSDTIDKVFDTVTVEIKDDLAKKVPRYESGFLYVPEGPGLGVELNEKAVAGYTKIKVG